MSEEWQTSREKLYDHLIDSEGEYHIKDIMRDLKYTDINSLIQDFNFILRNLKRNGKKIYVKPPVCMNCGYEFSLNSGEIRIPSKCPKCHEERLTLPMIKIENQ
ncbi:MAG: hypothetical protein ACQERB_12075 [Promethearchaeati archaeon]